MLIFAGVMELADVTDSKSVGSDTVRVRPPPAAPEKSTLRRAFYLYPLRGNPMDIGIISSEDGPTSVLVSGKKKKSSVKVIKNNAVFRYKRRKAEKKTANKNEAPDITVFTESYLKVLKENFEGRIWFVGLQGSYARGEATATSDIDLVVILDELNSSDIPLYNSMLDTLPHRELICGFLSGKKEIMNWETSDLFQFYYDTKPLYGSLDELLPLIDSSSIDRAIKNGACNIYHGCVHNMLYEKSSEILRGLYKSASFVVQAEHFRQTGKYVRLQKDLLKEASAENKLITETFIELKDDGLIDFERMSDILFNWSKNLINGD